MIGKTFWRVVCGLLLGLVVLYAPPPPARAQGPTADKSDLLYSTFLGGESGDIVNDIALDSDGNIYLAGVTCTDDFLTIFDPIHPELIGCDAFVAKFDANGTLVFGTALGGTDMTGGDGFFGDSISRIALDRQGNIYAAGSTNAGDFPTTPNAYDSNSYEYRSKAFIVKFDGQGKLRYSTLLGGQDPVAGGDTANDIAINSQGQVFITGGTFSKDFPTTPNAYDRTFAAGEGSDAFLTQLNEDGSALVYSTFLGRRAPDTSNAIALDASEDVIIAGETGSPLFPTTPGAYQRTFSTCEVSYYCSEVFIAKFSSRTGDLLFSTLIGGNASDEGTALVLDKAGTIYLTGQTRSSDFPVTEGAFDPSLNDDGPYEGDAFVLKLKPDGSALAYSTLLGGENDDAGRDIAIDAKGAAYVVGYTTSELFPTTRRALDRKINDGYPFWVDGFFVKLNPQGSRLRYGTFLGGGGNNGATAERADPGHDSANTIALGAKRIPIIGGSTKSPDFPTTPDAYDSDYTGFIDGFFLRIKPKFRK